MFFCKILLQFWVEDFIGITQSFLALVCISGASVIFFQWHDDGICESGKDLILELRQMIITLETEVANYKKREKILVVALALLMLICVILCLVR